MKEKDQVDKSAPWELSVMLELWDRCIHILHPSSKKKGQI